MTRKCIKVLVRTRPTANFSQDQVEIDTQKQSIKINRRDAGHATAQQTGNAVDAMMNNQREQWDFEFDKVLHNASQNDVFGEAAADLVVGAVDGVNATVLAYGQTGSGKTFTMSGDPNNFKQRGITPRSIAQLFHEIEDRPQQEFTVSASYMEIYNERIFDLLDDSGDSSRDYQITEEPRTRSMQVRGLTVLPVQNEEEALNVLFQGDQNRIVAEHQLNTCSNRSHSIFTLHIEQKSRIRSDLVLRSKLNLVDLAGSERLKKAIGDKVDESLRKESSYINKSLSYLEQCVVALTGPKRSHIPYRQTKLTNVLKDSLGGNCNTVLIACVSGEARHLEETISTLKLAQRMRRVENAASNNVQTSPELLLKRYERQIRELKQELMMHDALAKRSGVSYDEMGSEEKAAIAQQCVKFVEAAPGEDEAAAMIKVESVRQVQEAFSQFKILVRNAELRVEERLRSHLKSPKSPFGVEVVSNQTSAMRLGEGERMVGDPDHETGFALGEAPQNARPATLDMPSASMSSPVEGKQDERFEQDESTTTEDPENNREAMKAASARREEEAQALEPASLENVPVDRERAFRVFTMQGEGYQLSQCVAELSRQVKAFAPLLADKRRALKDVQADLDKSQRQVDEIRAEQKNGETKVSTEGEVIIDEEEYILLRAIKDLKKTFRGLRDEYDQIKLNKDDKAHERDQSRGKLLERFQDWFAAATRLREEKMAEGDVLDDGEQFDQLELDRVHSRDPESVAFFKATKAQRERQRRQKKPVQNARRV